jgi:hypothetical protein
MRIHAMLAILLLWTFVSNPSSFASDLALVHAKVYPSPTNPPIEDGTILVHNGRIRALGPSANIKVPRLGSQQRWSPSEIEREERPFRTISLQTLQRVTIESLTTAEVPQFLHHFRLGV